MSGRRADLGIGLVLVALCGLVYWQTTTFPEVPAMLSQNVPPTFFPRLVLTVIVFLSTVLLLRGGRQESEPRGKIPAAVFTTGVAMTAFIGLIPRLGTFATICLASIGLPLLWGERRAWRIGPLALGLSLSVYLIFVLALDMRFPRGLLP